MRKVSRRGVLLRLFLLALAAATPWSRSLASRTEDGLTVKNGWILRKSDLAGDLE